MSPEHGVKLVALASALPPTKHRPSCSAAAKSQPPLLYLRRASTQLRMHQRSLVVQKSREAGRQRACRRNDHRPSAAQHRRGWCWSRPVLSHLLVRGTRPLTEHERQRASAAAFPPVLTASSKAARRRAILKVLLYASEYF